VEDTGPVTVEAEGYTVTSTSETAEQITETLESTPETPEKGSEAPETPSRTARDAPGSDDADIAEAERLEKAGKLGKPRNDPKARMLAATREAKAAREERDHVRARVEAAERERDEYRRQIEAGRQPQQAAPPTPKAPEGKPQLDDFATYDEWVEAVADWKTDERFKARDAQQAQETRVKEYKTSLETVLGKAIAARKAYESVDASWFSKVTPDVQAIMNKPSIARDFNERLSPDNDIADEIIRADEKDSSGGIGPRMALYLSQNPQELQRIRSMDDRADVITEMRMIARQVKTNGAQPQRTQVSRASAPIRPVTGAPQHVDSAPDPDESSFEEHMRYWDAREKRARG
jgi:hypothetical protein